jgi:mono/diheme cytochrome c family protein
VSLARTLAFAGALLLAEAAAAQSAPESDYVLQCRGCHGPEGMGVPGLVPDLADMDEMLMTPEGRARLLQVPGIRQASLSDARLAALLTWAGGRFGGSDAPVRPISADEVAALRSQAQRGTSQTLR